MKTLWMALGLAAGLTSNAADLLRYEAQPGGGKMKIDGTATTGTWSVECAAIGGFIEADAAFPGGGSQPKVEISIPVRQLKSGKKAMDSVMLDAMKQPAHPKIEYKVIALKPNGTPTAAKGEFDATGTLKVAGVTRTNSMLVTVEKLDATRLKVTGTTTVRMTDFGIKPPSPDIPGGQVIKTGEEVKLSFEWTPEVEKK